MLPFDTELRNLEILYDALERELEFQYHHLTGNPPAANPGQQEPADIIEQVVQAGWRFANLAGKGNCTLDAGECGPEVTARAALLRGRLHRLLDLVARNAAAYEQMRSGAQESIQKLRQGSQFLHSVRGSGGYQPRFFDARE